jgi:dTDP-4-amino-4,6-dideoxygalactose transaminase
LIPFNLPYVPSRSKFLVDEALASGHHSGDGPFSKEAQRYIASITSAKQVLLTTSCTHALELAIELMNIGSGDEVIMPSFNFTSAAIATIRSGATPVFVDIDIDTMNMLPEEFEAAISPRTKAVIPVHYAGVSCDLDLITEICKEKKITLIEDNAHGLGGRFRNRRLGTFGELSTLSFHETKNIHCGEGGAICLNNEELLNQAEILREKGTDRSKFFRGHVDKYQWVGKGSSWLPSDILSALLLGQLEEFNEIQRVRHSIWNRYHARLHEWASELGFIQPLIPDYSKHTAHLYYLMSPNLEVRTNFIAHMRKNGIVTPFHYQALHCSPAGVRYGKSFGSLQNSLAASNRLVRLPMYYGLSEMDLERIISAATSFKG